MQQNYLLKKENLPKLLEALSKEAEVFVPCKNGNNASTFLPYNGQELFLEEKTYYSPKKLLHPPLDKEFFFRKKSVSYNVERFLDRGPQLLFGVRPCDTHAIKAMDTLFKKYYTPDPFYSALRDNTTIFALLCSSACSNGFCTSLGTDAPVGHDILLAEKKGSFFVEAATEKGQKLIEKHRQFFNKTNFAKPERALNCEKRLDTNGLKELLDENFFHEKWKQEGEKCLSCTSCTQVCPSCYCFLTFDSFLLNTEDSERFRCWDSCQLQRFTEVSGNHVFRKSRESRLRQFVMHKLSYFQENHDMMLCVGCGRCIDACPVGIDLTKIAATIRGEKNG